MTLHLWSVYLMNILVNSILMFFTAALLIEIFIFLLRIKNNRLLAYCRLIPFMKLPWDLFYYHFKSWALLQGIDPRLCQEGTRFFSASVGVWYIFPEAKIDFSIGLGSHTFSIADCAALQLGELVTISVIFLFVIGTLCVMCGRLYNYFRGCHWIKSIIANAVFCSRPLTEDLMKKVNIHRAKILLSDQDFSPFAIGLRRKTIVLPKDLAEALTDEEYSAVIAHEMEHIKWRDSILQILLYTIRSLFWWVPSGWWMRKLERNLECACDTGSGVHVESTVLASAIKKAIQLTQPLRPSGINCFTPSNQIVHRIQHMLAPDTKKLPSYVTWVTSAVLSYVCLGIFLGRFWIF